METGEGELDVRRELALLEPKNGSREFSWKVLQTDIEHTNDVSARGTGSLRLRQVVDIALLNNPKIGLETLVYRFSMK